MNHVEMDYLLHAGNDSLDKSHYPEALTSYEKGLMLAKKWDSKLYVGKFLTDIGTVYFSLAYYPKALEHYQQALVIDREIGNRQGEGIVLANIGNVYLNLAQYPKALEHYQQALVIRREIGDLKGEGNDLTGIGIVYDSLAQYPKALEHYQQALVIHREIGNRQGEGTDLTDIGNVYLNLAQYPKALEHYQQALVIRREIGDRRGEGDDLNNIAEVYHYQSLAQYPKALEHYQQALTILRETGNRQEEGIVLGNIGEVSIKQDYPAAAIPLIEQSLAIAQEIGARGREAEALEKLARAHSALGHLNQAMATYGGALALATTTGEPETLQRIQDGLRQTLAKQGQPAAAIFFGKQAVNTLQRIRGQMVTLDRALQKSFVGDKEKVYKGLADLLLDQGRLAEAEQVLAMLKEEELYDYLRRDAGNQNPGETQASLTQAEAPWRERYQKISAHMIALGQEYDTLKNKKKLGLDASEEARWQELGKDMETGKKAILAYLDELRETFAKMGGERAMEFGEKELKSLTKLQGTLRKLGEGVVLVHTLMTDTRLRMIVTTSNANIPPVHRESVVTAGELTKKIAEFRDVLTHFTRDPRPLGRELYQWIIAPIAQDLHQAKAKVIMVSLDDVLRYLPLAALYDGQHYLVEDYGVVVFTAAARGELATPPQFEWRMAGLGLSEVGDEARKAGFSALPAVVEELNGLVHWEGRQDPGGVLPGVRYLNREFTPAHLSEVLNQSYPVIHLASHFHFQPGVDTDSYLLLGDGGRERLTLDAFKTGDYPLTDVDLLTLSACQTAMSGRDAKGKELEGFGAMAQNQGAKAVLATLWSVADESTAQLMQHFYRLRQNQHLSKAEALRQAQLALLHGTGGSAPNETARAEVIHIDKTGGAAFHTDPAHPYAHPYYWAPFILMGNWL
jgi:CHAT domain-containing protein/molybdenum-dependent DNA-binding transcriptional regulator ModE